MVLQKCSFCKDKISFLLGLPLTAMRLVLMVEIDPTPRTLHRWSLDYRDQFGLSSCADAHISAAITDLASRGVVVPVTGWSSHNPDYVRGGQRGVL